MRATLFVLACLTLSPAAAAASVDPSGTWSLDRARSQGVPPVITEMTMVVTAAGEHIQVETRYATTTLGKPVIHDEYAVDGRPAEFVWKRLNGQEGRGQRTTSRSTNGDTLLVRQEALFDSPSGPLTWQSSQRWWLSQDGTDLTIGTTVKVLPFTTVPVTYVFKRV